MAAGVAVITGASSGIGAALAQRLADRGWRVVLAARREPELRAVAAKLPPGSARVVVADVTSRADVNRLSAEAALFGGDAGYNVWINNAGVGIVRPALELTDDEFDSIMARRCGRGTGRRCGAVSCAASHLSFALCL